jgi:uncharacterized protein YciI
VATFLVIRSQTGPAWRDSARLEEQSGWTEHAAYMNALADAGFFLFGGTTPDRRAVFAIEAESEDEIRERLAHDPWHESHLLVEAIQPWTIRIGAERLTT